MRDFRQLNVWEKSHRLVLEVYRVSSDYPKEEQYGLTGQMRRAAVSIPANIAEGYGRSSTKELIRYLDITFGSASELEYFLILVADLEWVTKEQADTLSEAVVEIKRMLGGLIHKLKTED